MVKDINENISDNDKMDTNDTAQQEMTETNPAFLKYLQFKVSFVVGKYKLDLDGGFWFMLMLDEAIMVKCEVFGSHKYS